MMSSSASALVLWHRLDTPGHDACRLVARDGGWQLEGTAVFHHEEVPARLSYLVACDSAWLTRSGQVRGWLGQRELELQIVRTVGGAWTLNGVVVPGLERCVDLDLGFTPATNLLPIRRLALAAGEAAEAPAAWLEVETGTLSLLPQRYERRGEETYWYEAPRFDYAALLEVTASGFIRRYPELWEMVV
jgi:uncharacterized protein